jgi:hypothetical protein
MGSISESDSSKMSDYQDDTNDIVSESKSFEDLKIEVKPSNKKHISNNNGFKVNEKEESQEHSASANESLAGG